MEPMSTVLFVASVVLITAGLVYSIGLVGYYRGYSKGHAAGVLAAINYVKSRYGVITNESAPAVPAKEQKIRTALSAQARRGELRIATEKDKQR